MTARPPLPVQHWNSHIGAINQNHAALPQVKYQVLSCQGQDILVGRLKIDTPAHTNGHAFILRRYDTGAISLTTMFRAAFPNAAESDEKIEFQWVKDNHNLAGNNGSSREPHITRLAGTWVSTTLATQLAKDYDMTQVILRLSESQPDPKVSYRRSKRGGAAAGGDDQDTTPTKAPKRLKEEDSSPSANHALSSPRVSSPPAAPASASAQTTATSSKPRRSTRQTKSPPPKSKSSSIMAVASSSSVSSTTTTGKPRSSRSTKKTIVAVVEQPPVSEPQEDEDDSQESQALAEATARELYEQDVQEQRDLIKALSSNSKPKTPSKVSPEKPKSAGKAKSSTAKPKSKSKRDRDHLEKEERLAFDFDKEPEVGERVIRSNKRVGMFSDPSRKSAAWGVGLFAFAAGAVAFLPNFF